MTTTIAEANAAIKSFRALMENEASKELFAYAEQSRRQTSDDFKLWRITDDANWVQNVQK
jgi:hypothetical protein